MVRVSCVTRDMPYMAHPHNLVGKDDCKNGIYSVEVCIELANYKLLVNL